jgi:hypothetical protein
MTTPPKNLSSAVQPSGSCAGCDGLRLSGCDINCCEGMCCYDGVYLETQEEEFLRELVAKVPELRAGLPEEFIVDGYWDGEYLGRKTAIRPVQYRNPDFPAHFTRTRCVFADSRGYCRLESFARARGLHRWAFKPAMCWMFPLDVSECGQPEAPPVSPHDDPWRTDTHPGYATITGCGRHREDGKPWREVLAVEIEYLQQAKSLPILGSPGHTVDELLNVKPDIGVADS